MIKTPLKHYALTRAAPCFLPGKPSGGSGGGGRGKSGSGGRGKSGGGGSGGDREGYMEKQERKAVKKYLAKEAKKDEVRG